MSTTGAAELTRNLSEVIRIADGRVVAVLGTDGESDRLGRPRHGEAEITGDNTVDLRGSYTLSGYKRLEAEFLAPRLFDRRGRLSVIGGWREATQVGFFGIGTDPTSKDDRVNYSFTQPYVSGRIEVWPTRRLFVVGTP